MVTSVQNTPPQPIQHPGMIVSAISLVQRIIGLLVASLLFSDVYKRQPPGKHWAPFVRGCVPACSDPGHDTGRLANHGAVKSSFARSLSTAYDRQRWLFSSSPGTPPGALFTFFSPVTTTIFRP